MNTRMTRTGADLSARRSALRALSISSLIVLFTALRAQGAPTVGSAPSAAAAVAVDVVVLASRIYTVDAARPFATAMAVRDGRVVFVGSVSGAMALRGPRTRVVDYGARTIVPGITDAHAHMLGLGEALSNVDLVGTASYDEVIARVVARAKTAPPGAWIFGRGWDQNRWGDTRFPTQEKLSAAVPDHPVVLGRVDGHAVLANAMAMKAAGVMAATHDPDGGRILRDAAGNPSGVFVDNAMGLLERAAPPLTRAERKSALLAAVAEANRWGLTGIDDAGESRTTIELYEELAKAGRLTLRAYVMIADDSADIAYYFKLGPRSALYDGHLWVRTIKLYADGALGSRGAALLDPYADDPGNTGLLVSPPEHLRAVAVEALKHGFQVATHAIGDRGNRVTLDAYESALKEVPTADHRFRVEHAQVIDRADIPRFAELNVIPSMQAVHQTSDMYWAAKRLGPSRVLGAYAWRALLQTGVIIPNGSDFPVEAVNPLLSYHSAITRQDAQNWPPGGWQPWEAMTREEALKSITIWPAVAGFQESVLGSLTPGKYADFVVYDRDIVRAAPDEILAAQVVATWVGGAAVYERK
jgi:predicted amidohydrolase YtcJ